MKLDKNEFLKILEKGALLANNAGYANTYLTREEKEQAFDDLENFADDCIGKLGMPAAEIKDLFFWANDSIEF